MSLQGSPGSWGRGAQAGQHRHLQRHSWAPCDDCRLFRGSDQVSSPFWDPFLDCKGCDQGKPWKTGKRFIAKLCSESLLQCTISLTRWSLHSFLGKLILFCKSAGILWVHVLYHTGATAQNLTLQLCSGNSGFSKPTTYPFSPKKVGHMKVLLRIRVLPFIEQSSCLLRTSAMRIYIKWN